MRGIEKLKAALYPAPPPAAEVRESTEDNDVVARLQDTVVQLQTRLRDFEGTDPSVMLPDYDTLSRLEGDVAETHAALRGEETRATL